MLSDLDNYKIKKNTIYRVLEKEDLWKVVLPTKTYSLKILYKLIIIPNNKALLDISTLDLETEEIKERIHEAIDSVGLIMLNVKNITYKNKSNELL